MMNSQSPLVNGWLFFLVVLLLAGAVVFGTQLTKQPVIAAQAKRVEVAAQIEKQQAELELQRKREEFEREKRRAEEALRHEQEMHRLQEERYEALTKVLPFAAQVSVVWLLVMLTLGLIYWAHQRRAVLVQQQHFARKEVEYRQMIRRLNEKVRFLESERQRIWKEHTQLLQGLHRSMMRIPESRYEAFPLAAAPKGNGSHR